MTNVGSGYTTPPTITFTPGVSVISGTTTLIPILSNGSVTSVGISTGAGYDVSPASTYSLIFSGTNVNSTYDGCFIAAALAGLRSGSVPHQGLTNTQVILNGAAYLNDVVNTYSNDILDNLASNGVWIVTQEQLGGTTYTRHQITAAGTSNLNYMEDSVTTNVDSISYGLQAALDPFKGTYNISPSSLLKVKAAIDNEIYYRATNTWTERAGNQVISGGLTSLVQDPTFKDKVDAVVDLVVPYPMNNISLTLSI